MVRACTKILVALGLILACQACGEDEIITEIENNGGEELTPRERAEEQARTYNRERRNDESALLCHVCRAVDGECGEMLDAIDAPPCEWEAVEEEGLEGRADIWTVDCVVIESCIDDAFVCDNRCP